METVIHLTPEELAIRLKKYTRDGKPNTGTLANWRVSGFGPRFIKLGSQVRYPLPEVEKWELSLIQKSTAG